MDITLKMKDGRTVTAKARQWATIEEIIKPHLDEFEYPPLLATWGNHIVELTTKIGRSCSMEFLDYRDQAAFVAYQSSLTFVYLKAVEDVLGRTPTEIDYAMDGGLYTFINRDGGVSESQVKSIEKRMRELVKKNIPIVKHQVSRRVAMLNLDALDMPEKKRILARAKDLKVVRFYSMGRFANYFYTHMLPSTGYVTHFELIKYRHGVLILFPLPKRPDVMPVFRDDELSYATFLESRNWQRILGINYVNDLNKCIEEGQMSRIIQLSEALHQKKIVEIAETITEKKKRVILIAGPSSSGKTSLANRLLVQLAVNGREPLYLGTDDYFVDRKDTPLDENGERDYENLNALDLDLFNRQLKDLLAGKEVDLPTYDFIRGRKIFGKRIMRLAKDQPILIEGIHGLNDVLTREIPGADKFKIFIGPVTELNIDEHNLIPTTDARLIRRMVRDYRYRGHSAQATIARWPSVRAGEERNIFPFISEADVFFSSVHIYELAFLKRYAAPLLRQVKRSEPEYGEARRLLNLLAFFNAAREKDEKVIVNNSILREFIGGSVYYD